MSAREKLNSVKKMLGVSTDQELAEILNTKKKNIDNWVQRNIIPDKWIIIMNNCVMEQKAVYNNDVNLPLDNPKQLESVLQHVRKSEGIELQYYPEVNASAGYGSQNDHVASETVTISRYFLDTMKITRPEHLEIIRIYGDSMEPDFSNGQHVVVERVSSIEEVKTGNTVIVNLDGDTYIKRIEKIPFEETFILHSSNNGYDPIKITADRMEEVQIVGIVRGVISLR